MQKIQAIIFDLGGVILDIDYNLTQKAFEKEGLINFGAMYSQSGADKLFRNLETGNITDGDFYKEINNSSGLMLSNEQISHAWNAMLLAFRENSLLFIDKIKTRYRLFLLSNTNCIHYHSFNKIYYETKRFKAFESFFEKTYYSFEIGMRKPDTECYSVVLENNHLNPRSTLFIDDSIQNIQAAKSLGLETILLEPGMYIEKLGL